MAGAGATVGNRGVVLVEPGHVELEEIRVEPPGPGEVLVRIAATGVCHSDAHVIAEDGWHHRLPVLLGHEGAGVVEAVGEGVSSLAPGDRVVLATDGSMDLVPRHELVEIVRAAASPDAAVEQLHRLLVTRHAAAPLGSQGRRDDWTIIVRFFSS